MKKTWKTTSFFGRSGGTWTHGLLHPKQARYQLRYTSIFNLHIFTTDLLYQSLFVLSISKNVESLFLTSLLLCVIIIELLEKLSAGVAELADAPDLGSGVYDVGVRGLSPAPAVKHRSKLGTICSPGFFLFCPNGVPSYRHKRKRQDSFKLRCG